MIVGASNERIQLDDAKAVECRMCGAHGHCEVFKESMVLRLFFVPVLRWNTRYIAVMTCCGAYSELPREIGEWMEKGEDTFEPEELDFHGVIKKHCPDCGYSLHSDFEYCPKCGVKI